MWVLFDRIVCSVQRFTKLLFLPDFCALCHKLLSDTLLLCCSCLQEVQPVASKTIVINKKQKYTIHSFSLYTVAFKQLIHAKFYGNRALYQELGLLAYQHATIRDTDFDIIVPIPLHWMRYAWRGFNQAEEMAKTISKRSGKPIVHFLKRVRQTKYQSLLKKEERSKNVCAAFQIALSVAEYKKYKDARILLIDDVLTTGSTIHEAIKTLGVSFSIHVLVAFRT